MQDIEDQPQEKPGFNLLVTYRDEKTGLVVKSDPYTLRVTGESGSSERQRLWERPKNSGNLFDKKGNPCGRWEYEEKTVKGKTIKTGKYNPDAEHIAFVPPPTKDQLLAQQLTEKDVKIAELEREMAAIKAEKEKKDSPPAGKTATKKE